MKQYCRYCNNCTVEAYCVEYDRQVNARIVNKCLRFSYSAIDVLKPEDKKGNIQRYSLSLRTPKKKQCDGQMNLF